MTGSFLIQSLAPKVYDFRLPQTHRSAVGCMSLLIKLPVFPRSLRHPSVRPPKAILSGSISGPTMIRAANKAYRVHMFQTLTRSKPYQQGLKTDWSDEVAKATNPDDRQGAPVSYARLSLAPISIRR